MKLNDLKNKLVGMAQDAAENLILENGFKHRLAAKDDEQLSLTMDYVDNRLNLHVKSGVVVEITTG